MVTSPHRSVTATSVLTSAECQHHTSSIWPWSGAPKVHMYDTFLGGLRQSLMFVWWAFSGWVLHLPSSWFTRYNAINQRFWLQYHTISNLQSPLFLTDTHLVCLSESSDDYAAWRKLLPFCKWLNLTHQDTFIHGPFDFITINGHKTWDHISQPDWDNLKAHCDMFHNPLLNFDIPSYSIHVDRGAHVLFMMQPLLVNYWFQNLMPSTHQARSYCLDKRSWRFEHTTLVICLFYKSLIRCASLRYDTLRWTEPSFTLLKSQLRVGIRNMILNLHRFSLQVILT